MTRKTAVRVHADAVRLAEMLRFAVAASRPGPKRKRLEAHRQRVIRLVAEAEAELALVSKRLGVEG